MSVNLSSLSREYIKSRVRLYSAGAEIDPTTYTVEWAFKNTTDEPEAGDWVAGSWESNADATKHWVRCLIGPGGTTTLTDDTYYAWVRLTGATEIPVRQIGKVVIT